MSPFYNFLSHDNNLALWVVSLSIMGKQWTVGVTIPGYDVSVRFYPSITQIQY